MTRYGIYTVEFVLGFFVFLLLVRFYISGGPLERSSRLSLAVNHLSNWLVMPMNRVVPRAWGLELSALFAAYLATVLENCLVLTMLKVKFLAQPSVSLPVIAASGLLEVFVRSLQLFTAVVIAGVVLSWLRIPGPVPDSIRLFCSRLLWPIRRHLPPVGGLDFSPLVALFLAQVATYAATDAMGSLTAIFR